MKQLRNLPEPIQAVIDQLPSGLYQHIQRVRGIANRLSLNFGLDRDRIDLAAATHDIARAIPGSILLQQSLEYGISIHQIEKEFPILLHGPVGAHQLCNEFGLEDLEILEAVHWHTTGHPFMGKFGQVIFLADKFDPAKKSRYSFIDEIQLIAEKSPSQAVRTFLARDISRLTSKGSAVHPVALATRDGIITKS